MCLQLVCYVCGGDLMGDQNLVPCLNGLMLYPTLRDHKLCPKYARKDAGAFSTCNLCSTADGFLTLPHPGSVYTESFTPTSVNTSTLNSPVPSPGFPRRSHASPISEGRGRTEVQYSGTSIPSTLETMYKDRQTSPSTERPARSRYDSGLRRLLPKTSAHQHASHSLAPPSRSMQNLQVVDGIGAVDFAAGSVETYGLAQRKADPVRQASAAVQIMRRPSQEHQNARMETHSLGCQSALPPPTDAIFRNPANSRNIRAAFPMRHLENPNQPREYDTYDSQTPSESMLWNPDFFPGQPSSGGESSVPPSPKIHVTRVWKSEKRQNRFPKVAVACDNCRYRRVKCSGEVPFCERCLRGGKQCGGYHPKTRKRQPKVAAVQGSFDNLSAGAISQSPKQHSTHLQVSAPRDDAWDLPFNQGLQQHMMPSDTTLEGDVETYPVGDQRTWLLGLFEGMTAGFEPGSAADWQSMFT